MLAQWLFMFALGAIASFLWIKLITKMKIFNFLRDIPNSRSSHSAAVPRGAGLVFSLLILLGLVFFEYFTDSSYDMYRLWVMTGILIAGLGFYDDSRSLGAVFRLTSQFIFISPFVYLHFQSWGLHSFYLLTSTFFIVFSILAIINFFNFADGINGYVALQFLVVLASWTVFSAARGYEILSNFYLVTPLVGGIFVFIWENMLKKSVFMGDSGSTFLGFMAATLPFLLIDGNPQSLTELPILSLATIAFGFILLIDIISVLLAKVLYRIPPAKPHKCHFYQRLSRRPRWGHSRTSVLMLFLQMFVSSLFLLAIGTYGLSATIFWSILGIFSAIYGSLIIVSNCRAVKSHFYSF